MTAVAQRLLTEHGGQRGLQRMEIAELVKVRGLGEAKAIKLKAALELGRRLTALSPDERPRIAAPDDVANLVGIEMAALEQEQLRVVLLDTKHRVQAVRTVYQGSVNHLIVGGGSGRFTDAVLDDGPELSEKALDALDRPPGHRTGAQPAGWPSARPPPRRVHRSGRRSPSPAGRTGVGRVGSARRRKTR